ncbi:MAG TPA: hypothetical protein VI298_13690 [Geobacteraceae bacterium]
MKKFLLLLAGALLTFANSAFSAPLEVVQVSAPTVNCVFNTSCTVTVSDSTAPLPVSVTGTNFLQSRTYVGSSGAPAAGLYAYEYRVNLSGAVAMGSPHCINSLTIPFGPVVSSLDLNGNGHIGDQVFVVTGGGLGTIGVASADQDSSGNITFTFGSPVCPGTATSNGQSSFFFGLVSTQPPGPVTATIIEAGGAAHQIAARAPQPAAAACSIPSFQPAYWNDCTNGCVWQPWAGCGVESARYCSGCGPSCGFAQCKNNCYNYANNKRTDTFAQPGCASSNSPVSIMSCSAVQSAAMADGLTATAADGTCPGGMDKVALVVAPGSDYHWYRLGSDGMWTHKPGMTQATNVDQSGHTISDPQTADRGGYTDFCGYLCTCSDAHQGQGHANIK